MEIDGLDEFFQRLQTFAIAVRVERGAELHFGNADACAAVGAPGIHEVLELQRDVTRIEAHAEMAAHGLLSLGRIAAEDALEFLRAGAQEVFVKKRNRLRRRFEKAIWLGLKAEVDFLAGFIAHGGEVGDDGGEIPRHHFLVIVRLDPRLKRTRHGADTAIDRGRQKVREDVRELHRVIAPLGRPPVGRVHVFFHRALMKTAIRKAVDRKWVELVLGKELARFVDERGVADQLRRGVMRKPQAEAEPLIRRDERLHRRGLFADRREIVRPAFARMNVQAVGEMKRRSVLDNHAGRSNAFSSLMAASILARSIW